MAVQPMALSTPVFFDPGRAAYTCPTNNRLYVKWDVPLSSTQSLSPHKPPVRRVVGNADVHSLSKHLVYPAASASCRLWSCQMTGVTLSATDQGLTHIIIRYAVTVSVTSR